MRTPSKKIPYVCHYTKLMLKYAKSQKHKNVYSDTCHTYLHNKQLHKPRYFNNNPMTNKQ